MSYIYVIKEYSNLLIIYVIYHETEITGDNNNKIPKITR